MTHCHAVYSRLWSRWGPQHWWPGETTWEIIVGAVLTQATNWKNVERAIAELRHHGQLSLTAMAAMSEEELAERIRSAGYYRIKARRLKNLIAHLAHHHEYVVERLWQQPLDIARRELLSISGIGPETADSILLYAGQLPTFVVDNYTRRIWHRHGWLPFHVPYESLRAHFHERLEPSTPLFNEYHALLVRTAKEHCRTTPQCVGCPLQDLLPRRADGTRQPCPDPVARPKNPRTLR